MLTKDFSLKVKALEDDSVGTFTGYASTYDDEPDFTGDVVEPGAFNQAIAQQGSGFPLLWAHQQDMPIGVGRVEDSKAGLIVHGKLTMADPAAVRAHTHLKAGSIKGLSIGYTVPKGEGKAVYRGDGSRVLREVHLHEVSLVAIPGNSNARVTSVKSLQDVERVLRSVRTSDVKADVLTELQQIDCELKRLLVNRDSPDEQGGDAELLRELQAFSVELRQIV